MRLFENKIGGMRVNSTKYCTASMMKSAQLGDTSLSTEGVESFGITHFRRHLQHTSLATA